MLRIYAYCIILCFLVMACTPADPTLPKSTEAPSVSTLPPGESIEAQYLALGDSYTIGESVEETERWPIQLQERLLQQGMDIGPTRIIAKTGWTTDELMAAIAETQPDSNYQLVSLLIGVNNQYRGYPMAQFEQEFTALLEMAIGFAGENAEKVFVLSIPDYGVTPFGKRKDPEKIARELDAYNAFSKSVCEEMGVAYFDITPISRKAAEDLSLVAEDELHPSGKMYTQWVELIESGVSDLLP